MRSAFGKPKIAFLLLFMLFSIGFSVCNVGASPDAETLYVDGFDSTYTEWAESGSSPYIDDSDDYIYESSDGDREGYFTFADTTHSGDIFNSVEIYFECYQVGSGEWFEVWIYDGSSWSDLGDITPGTSYSWKSMNITSKIDSWTKVDACQLYVVYQKTGKPDFVYVRRCYLYVDYTVVYDLNLRVMDWDLTDPMEGAVVYKDSDHMTTDENGWANWTQVGGTVEIQVRYFGYWVNGTSVTMDSNKAIELRCRLYDVKVAVLPNNQQGIIELVNATALNSTQNQIRSGITNATGQIYLTNLPNNILTFTVYAKSDYSIVIGNVTQLITNDEQMLNITADQNYGNISMPWFMAIIAGIALIRRKKR